MIFFGFRINSVTQLTFLLVLALFLPLASDADQAKLLVTGKDAMKMRLQMIKNARKEILAEYFEVGDDEMTLSGLAALRDAARHGVKVKILVDAINNRLSPQQMTVLMEESRDAKNQQNLEIREFNPLSIENFLLPSSLLKLSYRTHDKIFMVDEDQFILGSRNVNETYFGISSQRNFLDLDIAIKTSRESQKVRDYFYSVESDI